ncbi:MAG TPA: hypothetical protein VIY96_00210, partial [Thermoanaerobaculia bacterium]
MKNTRRGSSPAALGFRSHSGWATLVAVAGDPSAPDVLLRRRIEIADAAIEGSKQPYHAAEELDLPKAKELLRRCEETSRGLALRALRDAVSEVEKDRRDVVACGLLLASGKPLGSLE